MNKKVIFGIVIVLVVIVAFWFAGQVPPTEPVTPGYIRVYDYKLNYGVEYPEDWQMHSPEEVTPGGGIEKVEMFTKKGEATSITLIVKSTNWENLEEVKKVYGTPLKSL